MHVSPRRTVWLRLVVGRPCCCEAVVLRPLIASPARSARTAAGGLVAPTKRGPRESAIRSRSTRIACRPRRRSPRLRRRMQRAPYFVGNPPKLEAHQRDDKRCRAAPVWIAHTSGQIKHTSAASRPKVLLGIALESSKGKVRSTALACRDARPDHVVAGRADASAGPLPRPTEDPAPESEVPPSLWRPSHPVGQFTELPARPDLPSPA